MLEVVRRRRPVRPYESRDDLGRLEHGVSAVDRQVGDAAVAVDLAQHGPLAGTEDDVVVGGLLRRQGRYGFGAADLVGQPFPAGPTVTDLVEDHGDFDRRSDVLTRLLVLSEAPGVDLPAEQVSEHVDELFGDEGLDNVAVDVPQVHEQLSQPPALQLGALSSREPRRGPRARGLRTRPAGSRAAVDDPGRRPSRRGLLSDRPRPPRPRHRARSGSRSPAVRRGQGVPAPPGW